MNLNKEQEFLAFSNENIDFGFLISVLIKNKLFLIISTLIGTLAFIIFAYLQPDMYKSSALLKINADSSSSSSVLNNYQGIASLAGISMPSGRGVEKSELAIQIIKSRSFINHILKSYDIKDDLVALKNYDKEKKENTYDVSIINSNISNLEVHKIYLKDIITASKNKENFITISIKHPSPIFAEYLLRIIVKELNISVKEKDLEESSKAMEYLSELLQNTKVLDVRNSINRLIEKQLEIKMLASIKNYYVLEYVDHPFIPETKDNPSRAIIVIIGFFSSLFISAGILLFKNSVYPQKTKSKVY